tara:strand:+ start:1800 stop:2066 length:267 start_codon:yes stop_codon:yes gene_type:complete
MNKLDSIKRKIKYRSEYRGIKELDLLLGNFVKKYVNNFNQEELIDLYNILEIEDEIIYEWYFKKNNKKKIPKNKVSDLLKDFKINVRN